MWLNDLLSMKISACLTNSILDYNSAYHIVSSLYYNKTQFFNDLLNRLWHNKLTNMSHNITH